MRRKTSWLFSFAILLTVSALVATPGASDTPDAARIRLGDYFRLDARRKDVQGFQNGPYMHFWNVWLDR